MRVAEKYFEKLNNEECIFFNIFENLRPKVYTRSLFLAIEAFPHKKNRSQP